MKRVLIIASTFWINLCLQAQKAVPAFGEIDKAELLLKSCSFEPEANAMYLFSLKDIEFRYVGNEPRIETVTRVRIKVFNEKGYDHATVRIPYYGKKWANKIRDLTGAIYNLDVNGNIMVDKLEKKDYFKVKTEQNSRVISFTFPNLKPGSVIEFQYTQVEKWVTQLHPWLIQDEIPAAYASVVLTTPKNSKIMEKISGADSIPRREEIFGKGEGAKKQRTYYVDSIRSFSPEPFMSSVWDNLMRVNFVHRTGNYFFDPLSSPDVMWQMVGLDLLGFDYYGNLIEKEIPGTRAVIDSALKIADLASRIDFIYQAVQKRLPVSGEQTLYPDDIIEAWNNKTGNSAEINLILLNLLKKAKITSFPMLISTREHGKVNTQFPSMGQLDGLDVLAADSSIVYVLDASVKYQAFNLPPANVLNRQAFLLNPTEMQWVFIQDPRPLFRQSTSILCNMDSDGAIKGNAILTYYDYAKSAMLDTVETEEEKQNKFFDKNPAEIKMISIRENDSAAATDPLIQEIDFTYEPQNSGQFYFINPQVLFLKRQNPFVREKRNTDIDFGCNQKLTLELELNIPAGFTIEELPKNIIVRAPDTSFIFGRTFSSDARAVYLTQSFEIKRSVFDKEDYQGIKEFFTRVFALMAEDIVLKRK